MFMTVAPAAAAMLHDNSSEFLSGEKRAASTPDEAHRIGITLAGLVPDGNVRAMEALAIVIMRSDWGLICAAASSPRPVESGNSSMDRLVAAGERIARRALAGTLADPSRDASRFHRVGDFPDWARESRPVAQIGDFLFYRL